MERFVLVVGNARSGTTIVGAILDSHPNVLCANESALSANFWRGATRDDIIGDITRNSARNSQNGRPSSGYSYSIDAPPKGDIRIYADKTWNPALLLLAGNHGLLPQLSKTLAAPVSLIHCIRNPFDAIATMHQRSGASLSNRARWFFMHCEAVMMLLERGESLLEIEHETLTVDAEGQSLRIFNSLGLETSPGHLAAIRSRVNPNARRSRDSVEWTADLERQIRADCARYPFLQRYLNTAPG